MNRGVQLWEDTTARLGTFRSITNCCVIFVSRAIRSGRSCKRMACKKAYTCMQRPQRPRLCALTRWMELRYNMLQNFLNPMQHSLYWQSAAAA